MTRPTRSDRERRLAAIPRFVNNMRATANEAAARWNCDDPLWPSIAGQQVFTDWIDFTARVAVPIVQTEDDEAAEQEAMRLFRTVSPYYLCTALVMAARRAGVIDDDGRRVEARS